MLHQARSRTTLFRIVAILFALASNACELHSATIEVSEGQVLYTPDDAGTPSSIKSLAFSADDSRLVAVNTKRTPTQRLLGVGTEQYLVYDLRDGKPKRLSDIRATAEITQVISIPHPHQGKLGGDNVVFVSGLSSEWLNPGRVRRPRVTVGIVGDATPIASFQYVEDIATSEVAISPDLKMLAITSGGRESDESENVHGKLELWDLANASRYFSHKSENASVGSCAFSPDATKIVFSSHFTRYQRVSLGDKIRSVPGSYQGDIFVWDVAQKKQLHRLHIDDRSAGALAISPDGATLVSAGVTQIEVGLNAYLTWWNLSTGERMGETRLERPSRKDREKLGDPLIADLAYYPSGDTLAVATGAVSRGGKWGEVRLVDAKSRQVVKTVWEKHGNEILDVEFSHNGKWLAASTHDGVLKIWKVTVGN